MRLTRYDVWGQIDQRKSNRRIDATAIAFHTPRFRGLADMAGLPAGSTQSRLTLPA
jgi:hypothetical protein